MTKIYSPEELTSFSRETLVAVILSMQDQLARLLWALFRKAGCDRRTTGTGAHL